EPIRTDTHSEKAHLLGTERYDSRRRGGPSVLQRKRRSTLDRAFDGPSTIPACKVIRCASDSSNSGLVWLMLLVEGRFTLGMNDAAWCNTSSAARFFLLASRTAAWSAQTRLARPSQTFSAIARTLPSLPVRRAHARLQSALFSSLR